MPAESWAARRFCHVGKKVSPLDRPPSAPKVARDRRLPKQSAGIMIYRRVAAASVSLLLASALCLRAQTKPASSSRDGLDLRFADGIVAIVEDKIITVDDIRRDLGPLVPTLQKEARNEKEFNDKIEALQDDIIQNRIDKVLIVKEFNKPKDG